ncbi:MAG TPA: HPr family phosphocarrier protein [Candidatus Limnocylindrales bacterium]
MPSIELTVRNASGLHARPATLFVETAGRFASRITVENLDRGSRVVDAKSVLLLLTVGVVAGHRIRLTAEGPDADEALATLREAVESGLGEGAPEEAAADTAPGG